MQHPHSLSFTDPAQDRFLELQLSASRPVDTISRVETHCIAIVDIQLRPDQRK